MSDPQVPNSKKRGMPVGSRNGDKTDAQFQEKKRAKHRVIEKNYRERRKQAVQDLKDNNKALQFKSAVLEVDLQNALTEMEELKQRMLVLDSKNEKLKSENKEKDDKIAKLQAELTASQSPPSTKVNQSKQMKALYCNPKKDIIGRYQADQ